MTKRTSAVLAALLLASASHAATVLSFEQVLDAAQKSHAIPPSASSAAESLEMTPRIGFPTVRAEATASSAENLDLFAQNVFRTGALSALLAVDYPIADGGIREKQARVAKLDAESFRQRIRETSNDLFRETLDAVARLYTAQERLRVLHAGLERAVAMRDRAKQMLEMQEITNVTAAQWQDVAIAAESQLLDLDLQRLEAETHVKQLMGDTSSERIELVVPLDETPTTRALSLAANPDPLVRVDEGVARANLQYERKQLALEEAEAQRQPQVLLSAFGGVAALDAHNVDSGHSYGLYGLRFSISLPMFDAARTRRVAEARLEAEQAQLERRTTTELIRRQTSTLWLGIAALEKRIALLQQGVEVARRREESVVRLVSAGLRSENDVAEAAAERTRRESDLIGARVELWKYQQILRHKAQGNTALLAQNGSTSAAPAAAAEEARPTATPAESITAP